MSQPDRQPFSKSPQQAPKPQPQKPAAPSPGPKPASPNPAAPKPGPFQQPPIKK